MDSLNAITSRGALLNFGSRNLPDLTVLREVSLKGHGAIEREGITGLVSDLQLILPSLEADVDASSPCGQDQNIYLRNLLQDKLTQYRSLLSPIRKLPSEILLEIFFYCQIFEQSHPANQIDQVEIEISSNNDDFRPALIIGECGGILWKLTHVCYQWRTLLLNAPSFWSTFRIISYSSSSARQLELCLSRSGSTPLRFSLKDESNYNAAYDFDPNMHRRFATSHKQNLTPLLDLLYAHAHRWSKAFLAETNYAVLTRSPDIQIIFNPCQPAPNWLDLPTPPPPDFPTSFPQLHTLGLCNTLDLRKLEMYHVFSLFTPSSAPNLCHLILSNFSKTGPRYEPCSPTTKLPASLSVFPWTQLTSLTLWNTSAFTSTMLVAKSPNITRLRIYASLIYPFDGGSTVYPNVTLHDLEVFAIQGEDEQVKVYLEHLTARSLRTFRLRSRMSGSRESSVNLPVAVSDFLGRSGFIGEGDIDLSCRDNREVNSTVFGTL